VPRRGVLVAILGTLTAMSPLSIDLVVPGFPSMSAQLGVDRPSVQLTLTMFLIGLVVGQLVIGPLSDRLGRRPLLLGGLTGYAVSAAAGALAPSIEVLLGTRLLQGVAAATAIVLARAIVGDSFPRPDVPRYMGRLSQVFSAAPVAAPVVGGVVLAIATWRGIFAVSVVIGLLLLAAVYWLVPESLPPQQRHAGSLMATFRAMAGLAIRRSFAGYVLTLGFCEAVLFAYISGSSFVFQGIHGLSATQYSLIFSTNAMGMVIAGGVFARLSRRVRANSILAGAVVLVLLANTVQVVLLWANGESVAVSWMTEFATVFGIGMTIPATMGIGQIIGARAGGAAAALLGGAEYIFGAVVSPLTGLFGAGSSLPMATIMFLCALAALVSLLVMARPWRGAGEVLHLSA